MTVVNEGLIANGHIPELARQETGMTCKARLNRLSLASALPYRSVLPHRLTKIGSAPNLKVEDGTMKAILKGFARKAAISGGLEASHILTRLGALKTARGRGAIFTLHHVRPHNRPPFDPNGHLEITPEFLDAAIRRLKADGYRFVRLDDLPRILAEEPAGAPVAAFTLDDGYRDNAEYALPVFEKHGVPFTIFVAKGFSERSHTIWWETAEALFNASGPFTIETDAGPVTHEIATALAKRKACDLVCNAICGPREAAAIERLDKAARSVGVDPVGIVDRLVMPAEALRALARHPLASLGAHTVSHRALAFLGENETRQELKDSADYVEDLTGKRPTIFAYPYGDERSATRHTADLVAGEGFALAVTTRAGTLGSKGSMDMMLLPRISLNGYFQKPRYVSALASGIPFMIHR